MLRLAEVVLDGHPDKFCDILADRVLAAGYAADPECNGQIEAGCWSDVVWFSGAIVSRAPLRSTLTEIVQAAVETGKSLMTTRRHELSVQLPDESLRVEADPVLKRLAAVWEETKGKARK